MLAIGFVLATLGGVVVGVAWSRWTRRDRNGAPVPVTPADHGDHHAWQDVVDRIPLGVVVTDPGGRIEYRNTTACARQNTHTGLLVDAAIQQALVIAQRGDPAQRDIDLHGPPRTAIVINASPLPNGRAVAVFEDVSERRRVDAVRTDFVANISHELKTPIGALAVLAETLAEEDEPDVVRRVAARIGIEAERAGRTIDDLLELARIELGEEPVRDVVDLADVIPEGIARAQPLAELAGITINALDVPSEITVRGDRRQLVSALGNLVENAVKYSEPGSSVQVRVRAEGQWAEMMVADHGVGIPAAEHGRIFERFYRVDKGRGRDSGGTGLGLAIVRHVATNHGGDIQLSSAEGAGSTFVLRIPLITTSVDIRDESIP